MNFLKNFWNHHKVKTLGILAIIFGGLQVDSPLIRAIIPESYRGSALIIFGMLATIFGFINSSNPPPPPPNG